MLRALTTFETDLSGFDGCLSGDSDEVLLGSPNGLSGAAADASVVVMSAANAGTRMSQSVGNALMKKSLVMVGKVAQRDRVVNRSRDEIQKLLEAVKMGDARIAVLAQRIFLPNGMMNPGADPRDVANLQRLYADTERLGRRAIAQEKVNVLATTMRNNAIQQSDLLRKIAVAQAVGQPQLVATLTSVYTVLGKESDKIRRLREQQIINSNHRIYGLGDATGAEYGFGESLEELAFWKKLKKAARSVTRTVSKVSRTVTRIPGIKQIHGIAKKGITLVKKAAGKVLNAACKLANSKIVRGALKAGGAVVGGVIGTVYGGGPAGGAAGSAAGKVGARGGSDLLEAQCRAIKGLGLHKGKFNVKGFARGAYRGAKVFAKKNLSPKQLLADGMSVGGAYLSAGGAATMMGGGGGGGFNPMQMLGGGKSSGGGGGGFNPQQFLQQQGQRLLRQQSQRLQRQGQRFVRRQGQRLVSQYGGRVAAQAGLSPQAFQFLQQQGQRMGQQYGGRVAAQGQRMGQQYGGQYAAQAQANFDPLRNLLG